MSPSARALLKGGLRQAAAVLGHLRSPLRGDDAPRVICYHGVCEEPPDEWSVTPRQLRDHLELITRQRTPVALAEVVAWLMGERELPPRAVAVTFDDGYRDVLTHAAPLLAEYRVPGAAFVVAGLLDGEDAHSSYTPSRPLLGWGELRELFGTGWTIGAHSLSHPILADLPEAAARRELVESRQRLEQGLGHAVTLLAYPYGTRRTVSPREHQLAREAGYAAAFLDMTGPLRRGLEPFALPRSKVLGCDSPSVVRASLSGRLDLWRLVEQR
jgi:peptidoglycan/xylan/chitin deacetylase (PgdA/CDA1 family)